MSGKSLFHRGDPNWVVLMRELYRQYVPGKWSDNLPLKYANDEPRWFRAFRKKHGCEDAKHFWVRHCVRSADTSSSSALPASSATGSSAGPSDGSAATQADQLTSKRPRAEDEIDGEKPSSKRRNRKTSRRSARSGPHRDAVPENETQENTEYPNCDYF